MTRFLAFLAGFAGASTALAEPEFAGIFGDHLVVQRDAEISIWGKGADPSSPPQVRFGETLASAKVDSNGNWTARLPPQAAERNGRDLILLEDGRTVASLANVVVGEIWIAAGQSNMAMRVKSMLKGLPETREWIDSATFPDIRIRRVNDPVLENPKAESRDLLKDNGWVPMTPETVLEFSAVASVFARELESELNVPVGIIDVSWGGKPIEPFIPREAFQTPLMKKILELADAEKRDELASLRGGLIIRNPEGNPGAIFNARMAPLVSFRPRGFLWYQAESNAGTGEDPREYRQKMRALIDGWRTRWNDPDLPVFFVQLPAFPSATGWIRMREEQRRSLEIPGTGMAVTIDIRGEGIHPPDKIAVGKRLARLALAKTYGQTQRAASGPLYHDHRKNGSEVRVRFTKSGSGLMIGDKPDFGPPQETHDAVLRWFELTGKDGVWHPARAQIDGNEVVVTSAAVPEPVAVRYACSTEPQGGNLYNWAGLPASPFCSDLDKLPWVDPEKK